MGRELVEIIVGELTVVDESTIVGESTVFDESTVVGEPYIVIYTLYLISNLIYYTLSHAYLISLYLIPLYLIP